MSDLPRVSRILDSVPEFVINIFKEKDVAEKYIKKGVRIHRACEMFIKGEFDFDNEANRPFLPLLDNYKKFLSAIDVLNMDPKSLHPECRIEVPAMYQGTSDLIIEYPDYCISVDIKSGAVCSKNTGTFGRYLWQEKFYCYGYCMMTGKNYLKSRMYVYFIEHNRTIPIEPDIGDIGMINSFITVFNERKKWKFKEIKND